MVLVLLFHSLQNLFSIFMVFQVGIFGIKCVAFKVRSKLMQLYISVFRMHSRVCGAIAEDTQNSLFPVVGPEPHAVEYVYLKMLGLQCI